MLDGAMGTQLQLRGLTTEQKPELAAFIMPDVLTAVHRDYARAGADILLANTFGANPRKLKGTGYTVQQVIEASIACARIAAQETATNGPLHTELLLWMACAKSSLPVPLSPVSSTREAVRAVRRARSICALSSGLFPLMASKEYLA